MRVGADLDAVFAGMAESLANATLRLDKASGERLAALEGRTVQVESTLPSQVWSVRVRDARIEVLPGLVDSPDVIARGKPQDLLAWFASPEGQAAQRVQIEGDAALLAELAGVFKALAPKGFSPPIRGQDLLGAAELAAAVMSSAAESVAGAWREATAGRFVNRSGYGDFEEGIESLRAEIERLSARVRTLESARGNQAAAAGKPAMGTSDGPESGAATPGQSEKTSK